MVHSTRIPVSGAVPAAPPPHTPPGEPVAGTDDASLLRLRRDILRRVGPVLSGVAAADRTDCRLDADATGLIVQILLPVAVSPGVRRALAVRVLDAVVAGERTYGPVEVAVREIE